MDDIDLIVDAARAAGEIGLRYFNKNPQTWTKGNNSPVTEADIAIDEYLKNTLLGARPSYGWLSEESEDNPDRLSTRKTFVVDPIDGTRGFIEGTENWMISIAVVEMGCPSVGVLYGPVMEKLYIGVDGEGATMNGERIFAANPADLSEGQYAIPSRIATSIQERMAKTVARASHIHSLAYRIALVADGTLAGGIVRPKSRDWDLAAADLILTEAGGVLADMDNVRLTYNRVKTSHDWLFFSGKNIQSALQNAANEAIDSQQKS